MSKWYLLNSDDAAIIRQALIAAGQDDALHVLDTGLHATTAVPGDFSGRLERLIDFITDDELDTPEDVDAYLIDAGYSQPEEMVAGLQQAIKIAVDDAKRRANAEEGER